ncbi:MAG: PepSY-associated TM helix domain-containing protein [Solimonas sp.]
MPMLKSLWLRVHRWLALSVGWVLLLLGASGAVLVVAQPLDRALHPEFFRAATPVATADHTPLEPLRERLAREFGPKASFTFRPPREAGESLWVNVRGPWSGTVYFDPATGAEQGRRGETQGFVGTLFKLHSSLWLKDTGKAILAWVALAYLFMLVSGVILWWPRRWPPSWAVELRRGRTRALFDLHRVAGATLGLLIAMSVATGAYMAWRPLGGFVTTLSGAQPVKPPKLKVEDGDTRPMLDLDLLVADARTRLPDAMVGYVLVPAKADAPLRVRMITADDPHPNGLSSVWLDPRSGAVLGVNRWNELDPGARAVAWIYPLHTGVLGGPLLEAVIFISGSTLAGMGVTGVWLWWRRRSARRVEAGRVAVAE